jgi:hypothetical protein
MLEQGCWCTKVTSFWRDPLSGNAVLSGVPVRLEPEGT